MWGTTRNSSRHNFLVCRLPCHFPTSSLSVISPFCVINLKVLCGFSRSTTPLAPFSCVSSITFLLSRHSHHDSFQPTFITLPASLVRSPSFLGSTLSLWPQSTYPHQPTLFNFLFICNAYHELLKIAYSKSEYLQDRTSSEVNVWSGPDWLMPSHL